MTGTALTGTTAADLQNLLRDRLQAKIKHSFVELIPEELFTGMLDAAMDEFLNGPRSKRFKQSHQYLPASDERNTTGKAGYVYFEEPFVDEKYNVFADANTLPGMIYLELVAQAKANVKQVISNDPRFTQQYDPNTGDYITPIIEKVVGDNAVAFVQALMRNVVGYSVAASINNMRSDNGMGGYVPPPPRF
jgi:hypothetical protein